MTIKEPTSMPVNSTLADLLKSGNETNLKPYQVLLGHNMGFTTLLMSVPIEKFYDISEVANQQTLEEKGAFEGHQVAQRELDVKHAEGLARYILKGLFASVRAKYLSDDHPEEFEDMLEALGEQPYLALQPITANIRECEFGGGGLKVEKLPDGAVMVYLAPKHILWIIDGQHRREAMRILFAFLKDVTQTLKYPRRALFPGAESGDPVTPGEQQVWGRILESWRSGCTVMVEVHLGLNAEQERQLFHDLNNLTKKVAASLAFNFDNANPVNVFIKEILIETEGALFNDKVVERDNTPWADDKGVITRKDLVAINSLLFLNKSNARGVSPLTVNDNLTYAKSFWAAVSKIPDFGQPQAKLKTVAAQPVVLKSLAKLAYTFSGLGRSEDLQSLKRLQDGVASIDYSHSNPMWRFNRLSEAERDMVCPGLADYLPNGFVEVGTYDDQHQLFRFSPLHNDVMPIIGDMIRWALKLPNRFADRGLGGDDNASEGLGISVEIDFPALGYKAPAQKIAEAHASDTLRKTLEVLVQTIGPDALKKLANMRDGRRPVISENPERDFRIGESDKIYQNQRISGTNFFVLTNVDNTQKIKLLKEVATTLGLSSVHFRARGN